MRAELFGASRGPPDIEGDENCKHRKGNRSEKKETTGRKKMVKPKRGGAWCLRRIGRGLGCNWRNQIQVRSGVKSNEGGGEGPRKTS